MPDNSNVATDCFGAKWKSAMCLQESFPTPNPMAGHAPNHPYFASARSASLIPSLTPTSAGKAFSAAAASLSL